MKQSNSSWQTKFLIEILWLFFICLARTMRFRTSDPLATFLKDYYAKGEDKKASFLLFWHTHWLVIFLIVIRFKKQLPPVSILMSASRDTELVVALLERCSYQVIRGSSHKKSLQALKGIHKATQEGHLILIAADGPKGPAYQFKPGAIYLSQKYKSPIDLVHIKASWAYRLNTWDRLIFPLPFSQIKLFWKRVLPESLIVDQASRVVESGEKNHQAKNVLEQSIKSLQTKMESLIASSESQ